MRLPAKPLNVIRLATLSIALSAYRSGSPRASAGPEGLIHRSSVLAMKPPMSGFNEPRRPEGNRLPTRCGLLLAAASITGMDPLRTSTAGAGPIGI